MTDFNFSFSGDDDVKGGSIPNGTVVTVTAVPQKDDQGGEKMLRLGRGTTSGKPYMGIKFQVVEPEEYAGRKVDSTLWVDPAEAKFRAQIEMLTGKRIPRKGETSTVQLGPDDIEQALGEHSYRVKVGPDKNGYTEVKYYNERLERVEPQMQEIGGTDGGGSASGGSDFDDWGDDDDDDDF